MINEYSPGLPVYKEKGRNYVPDLLSAALLLYCAYVHAVTAPIL